MRLGLCLPEHRRARRGVESMSLERVEPNVSFAMPLIIICTDIGSSYIGTVLIIFVNFLYWYVFTNRPEIPLLRLKLLKIKSCNPC